MPLRAAKLNMSVEGYDDGLTAEERTYRWLAIRWWASETLQTFWDVERRKWEDVSLVRQIVRCERARAPVGRS
ncbi:MAG: hypothetical protein ACTS68_01210 [Candidatus Hodgkinia cicadicola]